MLLFELSQRQDTLAILKKLRGEVKVMKARKMPNWGNINRAETKIRYLKQQVELLRKDAPFPAAPLQVRKPSDIEGEKWKFAGSQDSEKDIADRERVIELIKENCKPFLEQIDYDVSKYKMFRGYKGSVASAISSKIRLDDRKPSDMRQHKHQLINSYFESKFGEPFRNAMFVSGYEAHATKYGTPFLVFPTGDFTFVWSPRVKDLYEASFQLSGDVSKRELYQWMDKKIYTNTDLKGGIKQRNEIMIRGAGYYGINIGYYWRKPDWTKFMRQLGKSFKQ